MRLYHFTPQTPLLHSNTGVRMRYVFLISALKHIDCGYALEPPQF